MIGWTANKACCCRIKDSSRYYRRPLQCSAQEIPPPTDAFDLEVSNLFQTSVSWNKFMIFMERTTVAAKWNVGIGQESWEHKTIVYFRHKKRVNSVWFQNSFPREICNLRTKDLGFSCAVLTAYKVGVFLFSRMLSLVFLRAGTNRVQKVIPNCFALASFYSVIGLEKHATLYETKN